MLAVLELWWNQFTVKVWDVIEVKKLGKELWEIINTQALLIADEEWKDVKIWTPFVEWSKVEIKVLDNFKWEKVRVFKMKSKKRYMRNRWFRQSLTKIEIMSIA